MVTQIDPVTTEIVRNAFLVAAEDMRASLTRSAYSPVIYESKDCSVGLFNEKGEILGQAPGLPCFLGALDGTLKLVIGKVGLRSFSEGDVYILNDTYITGSHLNDVVILSPVVYRREVIGFAATKAHWQDVGSMAPGWPVIGTTEIYQEGIRLGPVKLMKKGEIVKDIVDILVRNSRFPQSLIGDMNGQIVACRMGERRYLEIVEKFGLASIKRSMEEIFNVTEALERQAIREIPDGVYEAEGYVDNDGYQMIPFLVKAKVTIDDSEMTIDTTGSSGQRKGCTNSGLVQSISYCRLAYKFLVRPDLGVTGGSFRPLHIKIEPGSIFAAQEPTSCLQYGTHTGLLVDLIIKALSPVMPDRVTAGLPRDPWNVYLTGWHPRQQALFVSGEALAGGWGGSAFDDGESAVIHLDAGDFKNHPVETMESRYPIKITRYGLGTDSGGAGKFRGGLNVVKEYQVLGDDCHLSLWFDMTITPSWGLFGGKSGAVPRVILNPDSDQERIVLKVNRLPLPKGAVFRAETGGGGGYGRPWERELERVRDDVIDGYVSREKAEKEYGFFLKGDSLEIDLEAAAIARAAMAKECTS